MQFYKICGEMNTVVAGEGERRARLELAHKVAAKTAAFNGADNTRYCFVSDMGDGFVTFGIIATQAMDPIEFVTDYVKSVGLDATVELPDEITFGNMQNLLNSADRQSYIEDDNAILERFGLDRISGGRYGRGLEFGERLVNQHAKQKDLFDAARKRFANETLIPELERIYAGGKSPASKGHPVHYIVEADDRDARREIYKILLDALYNNQRLDSGRYTFLDFRPGDCYSHMAYEALYKVCEGGAVVVRYLAGDDSAEDSEASAERDMIEHICETAKRHRNKVLTVLCFPRECRKVKMQFYECLGDMSFIELREDFIDGESAKAFLASLAKENHVRTDKRLFARIEAYHSYLATELQAMFDEWYNRKLKTAVYPQYKDVVEPRRETVKAKPQGTAYEELMEMIGLHDAKQVIKKAINYYKMQKLYEEKGVKKDTPAMHMIFSGNPGTAKTTVARLFARIMRENGLLSRGHLVEVGRGDLVGKYVGWTAPAVQAKFKAASGGVLFIDEAYSLVDDRNGSFGDEAINTIVQEMENHRADVVVIFAGYPDKMEGFLHKNPGLRSRIAFHVPFADYDSRELCQIADMISRKNGMKIHKDAFDKLQKAFDVAKTNDDFGNGRYVRNIFEQAKMNQASRLLTKDFESITADEIITITADDIAIPEVGGRPKRRIGFC
ncbi:MAG: AAA family ATPase [Clostridia bacterium]|nr:AAA family ATPase [Clostridia bacterium]